MAGQQASAGDAAHGAELVRIVARAGRQRLLLRMLERVVAACERQETSRHAIRKGKSVS